MYSNFGDPSRREIVSNLLSGFPFAYHTVNKPILYLVGVLALNSALAYQGLLRITMAAGQSSSQTRANN